MAEIRHLENRHDVIFFCRGWSIWIKFWRLMQHDMSTAVMWSKSKPDVEFQYGGRLGEFNGMSSQSHVSYCRVLPLGEFTVTISEPHATLQGERIASAILKIVFRHILFLFLIQFGLWWAAAFVSSPIHLLKSSWHSQLVTMTHLSNKLPPRTALYNYYRTQSFGTQAFNTTKHNHVMFSTER